MSSQVWWFTARASGIVAWGVLSTSVLLGTALSTRALGSRPAPAWLNDLHRGSGGLAITFTAVHLAALMADTYVEFDLVALLVPFTVDWRPTAVAAGVIAFWLLLAVEVSSIFRRRLGPTWWRRIHVTSFLLWALATGHLLAAGTDADNAWLRVLVLGTTMAVAILGLVRMLRPRARLRRRPKRLPGGGLGDPARPQAPSR